jgi:hypothetical protein
MKPELQEQLFAIKPSMFNRSSIRESLMAFGFDCGDGWFDLLRRLITDLVPYDIEVLQVKEKFGTLRFYTGGVPSDDSDKIWSRIDQAELESETTCEKCGSTDAKLRGGGWIVTLCDKCNDERPKKASQN